MFHQLLIRRTIYDMKHKKQLINAASTFGVFALTYLLLSQILFGIGDLLNLGYGVILFLLPLVIVSIAAPLVFLRKRLHEQKNPNVGKSLVVTGAVLGAFTLPGVQEIGLIGLNDTAAVLARWMLYALIAIPLVWLALSVIEVNRLNRKKLVAMVILPLVAAIVLITAGFALTHFISQTRALAALPYELYLPDIPFTYDRGTLSINDNSNDASRHTVSVRFPGRAGFGGQLEDVVMYYTLSDVSNGRPVVCNPEEDNSRSGCYGEIESERFGAVLWRESVSSRDRKKFIVEIDTTRVSMELRNVDQYKQPYGGLTNGEAVELLETLRPVSLYEFYRGIH